MRVFISILVIAAGFLAALLTNNALHLWSIPQSHLTGMIVPITPATRPAVSQLVLGQVNLQPHDIPGGGKFFYPTPWKPVNLTTAWKASWHITGAHDAIYCTPDKSTCYNSLLFAFSNADAERSYYQSMTRMYDANKVTPMSMPALGDATSAWTYLARLYDMPATEDTLFLRQGPYFCALSVLGDDASPDVLYHTASLVSSRLATYG